MDAVVQLIRNALCCVKDLKWFESTFIHDAKYTRQFLSTLPPPLDETTPLEVLISITQLYACISTTKSGITLLTTSIGKLRRILRIVEHRMTTMEENKKNKSKPMTHGERIVHESLLKEAKYAFRSVIVGFLVAPIGICFWWLFINSWHITSVDWFGGLAALIHALEVMEVCLIPLLYLMIKDGMERLNKCERTKKLLQEVASNNNSNKKLPSSIGIEQYESMTGWTPFWDSGTGLLAGPTPDELELVEKEIKTVQDVFTTWFGDSDEDDKKKKDEDDGEKQDKLSQKAWKEAQDKLLHAIPVLRFEGYREFIYFFLNFIAFYGYLMAPLTFYYDDDTNQPYHVQSMKLWYLNADADWTGNFAGDLMWTIEPVIILASPFLITWLKPALEEDEKKKTAEAAAKTAKDKSD